MSCIERCPHADFCIHLGMSVEQANQLLTDSYRQRWDAQTKSIELEEENQALIQENKKLQQRIEELQAKLQQKHRSNFKKKADSSGYTKPIEPGKPKRGAPKGHAPWSRRKPSHVDEQVHVDAPECCPHCGQKGLTPTNQQHIQIQEDIELQPRTKVTEYIHEQAYCPKCRRDVFDTATTELRNCQIGPVTKAVAVYLRHHVKLSYRDIQKVFDGLFGMPFVPASAMNFSHRAAQQGANLYEDLRNKIEYSRLVHGDETHWRINGSSGYLWYAGNEHISYFLASYSRSARVAVSIFGDNFAGSLVADSYAAYNAINPKNRQACLAHIIRKAEEIRERLSLLPKEKQDGGSIDFCNQLQQLFKECCQIAQRRKKKQISFKAAKGKIPALKGKLNKICKHALKDSDAENLRLRVTQENRDALRLFTFLKVNHLPPTNNLAEQALRLPVILRKLTFGSRSILGAQYLAVNLSIIDTAKRQNRCPIKLLKALFLGRQKIEFANLKDSDCWQLIDSS